MRIQDDEPVSAEWWPQNEGYICRLVLCHRRLDPVAFGFGDTRQEALSAALKEMEQILSLLVVKEGYG